MQELFYFSTCAWNCLECERSILHWFDTHCLIWIEAAELLIDTLVGNSSLQLQLQFRSKIDVFCNRILYWSQGRNTKSVGRCANKFLWIRIPKKLIKNWMKHGIPKPCPILNVFEHNHHPSSWISMTFEKDINHWRETWFLPLQWETRILFVTAF